MKAFAPVLRVFTTAAFTIAAAASANADITIATFADPSPNASQPLFTFSSSGGTGSLSGSWLSTGLLLETPGLAAADIPDARMIMDPVAATGGPLIWDLGPGRIRLQDSGGTDQMFISFDGGRLVSPAGFASADFTGRNVTFSGPIVPGGLSDEVFAFGFANPTGTIENYTATASFTSSALPEPASIALLALGSMLMLRRRS